MVGEIALTWLGGDAQISWRGEPVEVRPENGVMMRAFTGPPPVVASQERNLEPVPINAFGYARSAARPSRSFPTAPYSTVAASCPGRRSR